jgi:hypothetical protein
MTKNQEKEFISLKEAAELSGYSPDYVGQLIRAGKLRGKQVYSNVAWVTTREDLDRYMQSRQGSTQSSKNGSVSDAAVQAQNRLLLWLQSPMVIRNIMYVAIAISAAFLIMLFYIFSVVTEKRLHERALQRLEVRE